MEENAIAALNNQLWFPPVESALPDGLLAIGGDLSADRLLLGYRNGIFPWFGPEDPVMWWSPDPRCVLFPHKLQVSKSMKVLLKRNVFEFKVNTAFHETIVACASVERAGQPGTWITPSIIKAYSVLHDQGYAHSAEVWHDNKLVGGLYGVMIGKVFFGESMFSKVSNASKYAFISMVNHLQSLGIALIDCQMHTNHLASLGAELIPRALFTELLHIHIPTA